MASQPELPASSGQPAPEAKPSVLPVDLDALIDNVKCSICMGILRNTHAVSVCMHRFCKDCIERWLRSQKGNNCPQCRVEFSSRRDCRADPQFDHLLHILFGDLDTFEEAIAPSATTMERAKAIGQRLMKAVQAQEERKQRPLPPLPKPVLLQSHPQQQQQQPQPVADVVVHVTLASASKQQPKQQQQQPGAKLASPAVSGPALKRSRSVPTSAEDAKRQRTESPELVSPSGSKHKGVRLYNGRYQARVKFGGKEVSLGHFDTAVEAAMAYDMEHLKRHGGKAALNLPHLRQQYKDKLLAEGVDIATLGGPLAGVASSAGGGRQRCKSPQPPESRAGSEEAMAGEDANENARQHARQLAQQHPMRSAFAGLTPVAHVRLEAAGGLQWMMCYLACPATTSVGELKQTMAFGLSQQYGTTVLSRPVRLAVQNDLDSSVNFDAICTADAHGSLLLRDHVTIRELLGLLEDCSEELVLEYSC